MIDHRKSLINEYKGPLFEFLVAKELAKIFSIENLFLSHCDLKTLKILNEYEVALKKLNRPILQSLPLLATQSAEELSDYLKNHLSYGDKIQKQGVFQIELLGKKLPHERKEIYQKYQGLLDGIDESDLLLVLKDQNFTYTLIPVSLKLGKQNSFINTKNGGALSFIERYFPFSNNGHYQKRLNSLITFEHAKMMRNLIKKSFDLATFERVTKLKGSKALIQFWRDQKKCELPGELPTELQEDIYYFYHQIIKEIFACLLRFNEERKDLFLTSLLPLLGIGHSQMIQLICFHKDHLFKNVVISSFQEMNLFLKERVILREPTSKISSFEIVLPGRLLQIRVKPMREFTAKAPKINCSVKHD